MHANIFFDGLFRLLFVGFVASFAAVYHLGAVYRQYSG